MVGTCTTKYCFSVHVRGVSKKVKVVRPTYNFTKKIVNWSWKLLLAFAYRGKFLPKKRSSHFLITSQHSPVWICDKFCYYRMAQQSITIMTTITYILCTCTQLQKVVRAKHDHPDRLLRLCMYLAI